MILKKILTYTLFTSFFIVGTHHQTKAMEFPTIPEQTTTQRTNDELKTIFETQIIPNLKNKNANFEMLFNLFTPQEWLTLRPCPKGMKSFIVQLKILARLFPPFTCIKRFNAFIATKVNKQDPLVGSKEAPINVATLTQQTGPEEIASDNTSTSSMPNERPAAAGEITQRTDLALNTIFEQQLVQKLKRKNADFEKLFNLFTREEWLKPRPCPKGMKSSIEQLKILATCLPPYTCIKKFNVFLAAKFNQESQMVSSEDLPVVIAKPNQQAKKEEATQRTAKITIRRDAQCIFFDIMGELRDENTDFEDLSTWLSTEEMKTFIGRFAQYAYRPDINKNVRAFFIHTVNRIGLT